MTGPIASTVKRWFCALAVLLVVATLAHAQETNEADETDEPVALDSLSVQLRWLPQTQFAGFYLAQSQGYYTELGLDVTLLPGSAELEPIDVLRRGQADVIVDWMALTLIARQDGLALVNIAQFFQTSGQAIACRRDTGVQIPEDMRGKTLATAGYQPTIVAWLDVLGIPRDGSAEGVEISDRGAGVDDLVSGAVDCVAAQTYNELELLSEKGFDDSNLTVFRLQEYGAATLQDGIYVTEAILADPEMVSRLVRFIKATLRGWRVAVSKPESATDIVMNELPPDASREHQRQMMGEVRKLIGPTDDFLGLLVPEDYDITIEILSEAGILSGTPSPAWTHSLWLQAQ